MRAIVIPANSLTKISTANGKLAARAAAGKCRAVLHPMLSADGRQVVSADVLDEIGPGGLYEEYAAALAGLVPEEVEMPPQDGES